MCDPVTATVIGATVASTAIGAYSSVQQGRAAQKAAEYDAQIAERNAVQVANERVNVQDAAAIERRRLGERLRAERGQQIADSAAMGLDTGFGTPADLIGDYERSYRVDRSILGRNEMNELQRLDLEEQDYRDSASQSRASGKAARKAGNLAVIGSILDGASSVSSQWIKANPSSVQSRPRGLSRPIPRAGPASFNY